jgi:hypothetical protein
VRDGGRAESTAPGVEPDENAGSPRCGDYVGAAVAIDIADNDLDDAIRKSQPLSVMAMRRVDDQLGAAGSGFNPIANAVAIQVRQQNLRGGGLRPANEGQQDRNRRQNPAADYCHHARL